MSATASRACAASRPSPASGASVASHSQREAAAGVPFSAPPSSCVSGAAPCQSAPDGDLYMGHPHTSAQAGVKSEAGAAAMVLSGGGVLVRGRTLRRFGERELPRLQLEASAGLSSVTMPRTLDFV